MFDIGFWELMAIAVLALVVVGPNRLPTLLGTVGRWVGIARGYLGTVRSDIEREVKRAETMAKDNEVMQELRAAGDEAKAQTEAMQTEMQQATTEPAQPATATSTEKAPANTSEPR